MAFLLDTNVLSELRKGRACDVSVRQWALSVADRQHFISVLSIGEIRRGIETLRRRSPEQCPAFEKWLESLLSRYNEQVIRIDESIVDRWGIMNAERTMPVIDGLIAASAAVYQLTVVTRNIRDFQCSGVPVIDPFQWKA